MDKVSEYKDYIYKTASEIIFNKMDNKRIAKIETAANSKNTVFIKYKDKKGNITQREVEPYKLEGNDFWAYDENKNNIRRFKIKNIKSLSVAKNSYEPRWPIEIGGKK